MPTNQPLGQPRGEIVGTARYTVRLAIRINTYKKTRRVRHTENISGPDPRPAELLGRQGCALLQPYDMEVGAGTFHPATFLRAIGPEPWRAAYVQPSRRPTDGRYGENPNRLQHYYQFQVVLKPSALANPGAVPGLAARTRH